jgi:hypothetical protein
MALQEAWVVKTFTFPRKPTQDGVKQLLLAINSKDEESGPVFSRDGKYFFFTRAANLGNYEYGEWSIYFMETKALNLPSLFK